MADRLPPIVQNPPDSGAPPVGDSPWEGLPAHLPGRANISRRRFIKGVIATGASVSAFAYFAGPAATSARASVPRLVSIRVNGRTRRVDVLPQETLAMTLRYKLGLIGTKLGCDRAECGACTVMIDGVSHYSCSTLTQRVRDREVITVEGLESPDGTLHPVQQRLHRRAGVRSAASAPLDRSMAAAALLRANPNPTREEARRAMSGNLCRCGAYDHYLNGVMRAAAKCAGRPRRRCPVAELIGRDFAPPDVISQGHRKGPLRGGLPRRRHALLPPHHQPHAPRAGARHRRFGGTRDGRAWLPS